MINDDWSRRHPLGRGWARWGPRQSGSASRLDSTNAYQTDSELREGRARLACLPATSVHANASPALPPSLPPSLPKCRTVECRMSMRQRRKASRLGPNYLCTPYYCTQWQYTTHTRTTEQARQHQRRAVRVSEQANEPDVPQRHKWLPGPRSAEAGGRRARLVNGNGAAMRGSYDICRLRLIAARPHSSIRFPAPSHVIM